MSGSTGHGHGQRSSHMLSIVRIPEACILPALVWRVRCVPSSWIPKVDPHPSQAFDIIQPVLQYPGDNGDYWSVKSW